MTKKVIYFTAGEVPTGPETAAIDKLRAAGNITAPYEVVIRNSKVIPNYGDGRFEACDYRAGTLPADTAANAFYTANTAINPDAIPNQNITTTQAIVSHNVDIVVPVTGTYATKIKPTIVNGVITGFVLS